MLGRILGHSNFWVVEAKKFKLGRAENLGYGVEMGSYLRK